MMSPYDAHQQIHIMVRYKIGNDLPCHAVTGNICWLMSMLKEVEAFGRLDSKGKKK